MNLELIPLGCGERSFLCVFGDNLSPLPNCCTYNILLFVDLANTTQSTLGSSNPIDSILTLTKTLNFPSLNSFKTFSLSFLSVVLSIDFADMPFTLQHSAKF